MYDFAGMYDILKTHQRHQEHILYDITKKKLLNTRNVHMTYKNYLNLECYVCLYILLHTYQKSTLKYNSKTYIRHTFSHIY